MKDKVVIRDAVAGDRDAAKAIAAAGMREFDIVPDFEGLDRALGGIGAPRAGRAFDLVAEVDGRICGSLIVSLAGHGTGKLNGFYIDPSVRGRGIGRKLLATAVARARQMGLGELTLETWGKMRAAVALYEATGWIRCDDPPHESGSDRAYRLPLEP